MEKKIWFWNFFCNFLGLGVCLTALMLKHKTSNIFDSKKLLKKLPFFKHFLHPGDV